MKIRAILFAFLVVAAAAPAKAETKIEVRLEAFDLLGDPISIIPLGSNFELRAFVDDVRQSTPLQGPSGEDLFGVFAAYVEVAFDAGKVVDTGPLVVDDFFDDFPVATLSSVSPGLALGGGSTSAIPNPGSAEQLLFTVPLGAIALGSVVFSPSFFGDSSFEWLMYGEFDSVLPEEVQFSDLEVTIVPEPAGIALCTMGLLAVGALSLRCRKATGKRKQSEG